MHHAARRVATAVSVGRLLLGGVAVAAPQVALRPWVGTDAWRPSAHVLARGLGARDLAFGVGTLHALGGGRDPVPWLLGSAFNDATDAWATIRGWRDLAPTGRYAVLASAAGTAAVCVLTARALRRA